MIKTKNLAGHATRTASARNPARMIAVASGEGGVGKTWFAITLAHALAMRGARVLLFDGDLGLANVDIQLGLTPVSDLSAVVSGRLTLDQAVLHHHGGFAHPCRALRFRRALVARSGHPGGRFGGAAQRGIAI